MINKPLVIGAPRSGFTLLISSLIEIQKATGLSHLSNREIVLKAFVDRASRYITSQYQKAFADFGLSDDLIFNGEFHLLVGGPKWINQKNTDLVCFRKYIGIRGQGDFLLIISHPKQILDYYEIVHSHLNPKLWLEDSYYKKYQRFASVRNPIGIINSASFSLNALTSEYVQRFCPDEDETLIRQRLAFYKLTDLDFFRGLIKYLVGYLEELLTVKDEYILMKWEDLIGQPVATIRYLAEHLQQPISSDVAAAIWQTLDHKNLLAYHKHNYRKGKGVLGDWKKSLVNEHLEIFEELNFNKYLTALGYNPIEKLDPDEYSPYQKLLARYIQRNEIYRSTGDPDLFGFAFNKSNIDASKFNFKSFEPKQWTHVERSTIENDSIVEEISDIAEQFCDRVNPIFQEIISADLSRESEVTKLIQRLNQQLRSLGESSPQCNSNLEITNDVLMNMKF